MKEKEKDKGKVSSNVGEKKRMSKAIGKDGRRQQRLIREGVKMCVCVRGGRRDKFDAEHVEDLPGNN